MCVQSFGTLRFSNLAGPLVMFTVGNGNMMEHVLVPYSAQQLLYPKKPTFFATEVADISHLALARALILQSRSPSLPSQRGCGRSRGG